MRTAIATFIAVVLLVPAVPAFAEDVPMDPTVTDEEMMEEIMPAKPKTNDELMDEACRETLNIAEGAITKGYLLHSYRACLRLERQRLKAEKDGEIMLEKTSATNERAKPVLDRLRAGSKRLIQNQGKVRHQVNAKQKLKAGKKTLVRFRRRSIFRVPAAGTGSTQP